jgi:hypothetical protein
MTPAEFIARQRAERAAAGLPPTITDLDTLRVVAALVTRRGGAQ